VRTSGGQLDVLDRALVCYSSLVRADVHTDIPLRYAVRGVRGPSMWGLGTRGRAAREERLEQAAGEKQEARRLVTGMVNMRRWQPGLASANVDGSLCRPRRCDDAGDVMDRGKGNGGRCPDSAIAGVRHTPSDSYPNRHLGSVRLHPEMAGARNSCGGPVTRHFQALFRRLMSSHHIRAFRHPQVLSTYSPLPLSRDTMLALTSHPRKPAGTTCRVHRRCLGEHPRVASQPAVTVKASRPSAAA
jgi:hypothetical protein